MTSKAGGPERARVDEIVDDQSSWRRWGPYLSDRAWGTVREDYSADGNAWQYLPYEHARSRTYRWGEDAIGGVCDRYQILCMAPAFWNGQDSHLKERLYGVNPYEGNHGEDVKEYYFHVDNTPTHSYMKLLYKYPQARFPYEQLVKENQARHGVGPEYELLDTGIFDDDRYFDIEVEYAKADAEDLVMRITVHNRGPDDATIHVLPHLWFRNTWSWGAVPTTPPRIEEGAFKDGICLVADDGDVEVDALIPRSFRVGRRFFYGPRGVRSLFTDNETNAVAVFGEGNISKSPFTKDAFHRFVVDGDTDVVNPENFGSKAAIHYRLTIKAGTSEVLNFRMTDKQSAAALDDVDAIFRLRKAEADEFYASIHPDTASDDEKHVQRRALAGALWTKQSYIFDVARWLDGDNPDHPPPQSRRRVRNQHWRHLNSMRVMTMPDKWEYPWFAAWDLAFQCVPFALVDAKFAKEQLWMLLFEQFQHPSGQLPAYEWEFSDLNPPVHAWAVWRVYNMDRIRNGGVGDRDWLERCFHKMLINFTSWVNKVDREGNNVFEGGFLGLDNITVIDRSEKLPDGSVLEQSDATGWMGMFCLNLMRIALELARENAVYEGLASKFLQHYTYVAYAMKHMGNRDYSLFDVEDGFFYDVLRYPDGKFTKFRVRSLVGLIPLFAVERLEVEWLAPFKEFNANLTWFMKNRREMVEEVIHTVEIDGKTTHLLTIVNQLQLKRMLERMHNETEFLSRYGIRSMSKFHEDHPFEMDGRIVRYEPAESDSKLKGGNSNWRGPLWFPTSFLIIESLRKLGTAFGPRYKLKTPVGGETAIGFRDIARDVARRMIDIFLVDEHGKRPVWGGSERFQTDEHWRDEILFYEYFHGDNGAGVGASHQTGWTALVANLIDEWR